MVSTTRGHCCHLERLRIVELDMIYYTGCRLLLAPRRRIADHSSTLGDILSIYFGYLVEYTTLQVTRVAVYNFLFIQRTFWQIS